MPLPEIARLTNHLRNFGQNMEKKTLGSGDELDSGAIKDKASKIAYLDKLVALVGLCSGHEINARPSKIVAGLEPEGTNALLTVRKTTGKAVSCSERLAVLHLGASTGGQWVCSASLQP